MAQLTGSGGDSDGPWWWQRRLEVCGAWGRSMIKTRGGGGLGGGHGGGTWWCGGNGSSWSPSLIFLAKPLERENTSLYLQMTARICGLDDPCMDLLGLFHFDGSISRVSFPQPPRRRVHG